MKSSSLSARKVNHSEGHNNAPPLLVYIVSIIIAESLTSELTKINTFYSEKLAEATRKIATLKSDLASSTEKTHASDHSMFGFGRKKGRGGSSGDDVATETLYSQERVPARKLQDLKLAFSEYYLSLVLIQNYQNLNFTGE